MVSVFFEKCEWILILVLFNIVGCMGVDYYWVIVFCENLFFFVCIVIIGVGNEVVFVVFVENCFVWIDVEGFVCFVVLVGWFYFLWLFFVFWEDILGLVFI